MDNDDVACALAAMGGFAESTLFFIVPDVWLSSIGMRSMRTGFRACVWALGGALAGGAVMYGSARVALPATEAALARVPGVHHATIQAVRDQIAHRGLVAVLLGPIQGRPYKIYAIEWAGASRELIPFLAISVPARIVRFLLSTMIGALLARVLSAWAGWAVRRQRVVLAALWVVFYGWYFHMVGW